MQQTRVEFELDSSISHSESLFIASLAYPRKRERGGRGRIISLPFIAINRTPPSGRPGRQGGVIHTIITARVEKVNKNVLLLYLFIVK